MADLNEAELRALFERFGPLVLRRAQRLLGTQLRNRRPAECEVASFILDKGAF